MPSEGGSDDDCWGGDSDSFNLVRPESSEEGDIGGGIAENLASEIWSPSVSDVVSCAPPGCTEDTMGGDDDMKSSRLD